MSLEGVPQQASAGNLAGSQQKPVQEKEQTAIIPEQKSEISKDNLKLGNIAKKDPSQNNLLNFENISAIDARAKVAAEHGITLKPDQVPLVDTHADRSLHSDYSGSMEKPFNKIVHALAPNWGPFITEESLKERGVGAQIMSVPTDGLPPFYFFSQGLYSSLIAGRPDIASETRLNRVVDQTAFTYRWVDKNPDKLTLAWSYADVVKAIQDNKIALMPAIEGAQFLVPENGPDSFNDYEKNLQYFIANPESKIPPNYPIPTKEEVQSTEGLLKWSRRIGVLYIGMNHLGSNRFAGSDLGIGDGDGLSKEGIEVIRQMQKNGILLDLAHASQATQKQIKDLKLELPVMVSHGVIALNGAKPDWRDTRPEVLEEIKRTGGVFGVMFATQYLPNGTVDDIVKEIIQVRNQIGIEHIAIGTDADGFVNLAIKDMKGVSQVFDALRKEGFNEEDIARISFGNFLSMLKKRDDILAKKGDTLKAPVVEAEKVLKPFTPVMERVYGINLEAGATVINMNGLMYGGMLNFETSKFHSTDPFGKADEYTSGFTSRIGAYGNQKDFLVTASTGFKYGTAPSAKWLLKLEINPSVRVDYSKSSGFQVGPEIGFGIGTNIPNLGNLYIRPYVATMTNFKEVNPVVGVSLGLGFDWRHKTSE